MTSSPRLVRLADHPGTLPAALVATWARGDAAVVAPAGADLPSPIIAALAGGTTLPPDTALVVPTSGSSGAPRAVVLGHAALAASTAASLAALGCVAGERWALALPLRHVAGLQVLARARALGTEVHVISDPGDPGRIAAAADRAQHVALVPTQLVRCLDAGVDLRGFRSVLVGGGPLDPRRAEEARAAGIRLVQSYGMTETCGGCVYNGRPLAGITLAVTDERIRIAGPMLATGYLDPSAGDAARFTPDGWFATDDIGVVHDAGAGGLILEVFGRADDVINTGGVKVAPATVETILLEVPGVLDAVVVGIPDDEWGERVRAVIVPAERGEPPTLDALRRAVCALLPVAHAPRELVVVESLRRDGLGKLSALERARLTRIQPIIPG
jgi:o-succinylbenzoate---CoA ligase